MCKVRLASLGVQRAQSVWLALAVLLTAGGCDSARRFLEGDASAAGGPSPLATDLQTQVWHRISCVFVDRSPRNWWRQESSRRIRDAIVSGSGPGDKLVLIYLRPRFVPEECVMAAAEFPPDSPAYRSRPANKVEFDALAASLAAAWQETKQMQGLLTAFLAEPVTREEEAYEAVAFEAALEYAAGELNAASSFEEKHLLIFGPLPEQATATAEGFSLDGVHVKALYCPRPSSYDWDRVKGAWSERLVDQAKAADFVMLDRAQSVGLPDARLFAASTVPERPTSPFVAAGR